jgi:hypothetical protein
MRSADSLVREFQAGASGNFPTLLRDGLAFGDPGGVHGFGNLAGGKFGDVGKVAFAVGGGQFQSVTICHRLTSLLAQPLFQLVPMLSGRLVIGLLVSTWIISTTEKNHV